MSNIGRKPIDIGSVQVNIKGQEIHYKGPKDAGVYVLPSFLKASLDGNALRLILDNNIRKHKNFWGMHRALLANEIRGAGVGFEKQLEINGLGFKAALTGNKIVFSLGYSHKIEVPLPDGVKLEIDKTGQKLTFKAAGKALLGQICDTIRSLRPPEPYKGTGIKLATEVIKRKAGKTKAA